MLKSRHIFIQQGALTPNDNGKKKFNSSEVSLYDEILLEYIADINKQLNVLNREIPYVLIVHTNDVEIAQYTLLEKFNIIQQHIICADDEIEGLIDTNKGTEILIMALSPKYCENTRVHYLVTRDMEAQITKDGRQLVLADAAHSICEMLLQKIKRINDRLDEIASSQKVIIYGGGYQTEAFLRYANVSRLNIIRIVDKRQTEVFNCITEMTNRENLVDADVIIVTPYFSASDIRRYLSNLNLDAEIIYLDELSGETLFTNHENIWAPDIKKSFADISVENEKKELLSITQTVNEISPYYVGIRTFQNYHTNCSRDAEDILFESSVAIVVQGPIVQTDNFTLDSVKLYRNNFPDATIIVSVWEGESFSEEWRCFRNDKQIYYVFSQRPEHRGYQNVNLQLTTSYNGLKKAQELGCRYAFKIRSDMRYYSPDMVLCMQYYMKSFPMAKNKIQKERLVIFPPRMDYFYFISDFFMFGNVDDMLNYWDIDRAFGDDYIGESAETMLGIRYAEFIRERYDNKLENLQEYDRVLKQYFAIVEDKLLDYIWFKYFYNKQWYAEYHYNVMNYVDWLEGQEIV